MAEDAVTAHAQGHPQASYGETDDLIHKRQRLGVLYFLAADAVFVACLIFTYYYLRGLNTDGGWLPKGVSPVSAVDTWTVAAIIIVSAICYQVARRAGNAGNTGMLRMALGLALIFLVADLVVQVVQLAGLPFTTTSGAYASTYYVMASYHVFHLVVLGLLGLGLLVRTLKGIYDEPSRRTELDIMGLVWTWAAISAALFAFALLFTGAPHA